MEIGGFQVMTCRLTSSFATQANAGPVLSAARAPCRQPAGSRISPPGLSGTPVVVTTSRLPCVSGTGPASTRSSTADENVRARRGSHRNTRWPQWRVARLCAGQEPSVPTSFVIPGHSDLWSRIHPVGCVSGCPLQWHSGSVSVVRLVISESGGAHARRWEVLTL
jgi:hypothetical protein